MRAWLRARLGTLPETIRYGRVPGEGAYHAPVLWDDAGNHAVRETLAAGDPCLVARLGLSETWCASFASRWRRLPWPRPSYPAYTRELMTVNAGVFPGDDATLDRFAEIYLDGLTEADVMAVWFNRGEPRLLASHCPDATLVELNALNAMCHASPWSSELAGRRVLVIHPFAESIERQYLQNRTVLFDDPAVLPAFELITLMPVQSIAGTSTGFPDWPTALEHTCERIGELEFDIALIGAGAYGLSLGAFVKRMGRQAVHLGGATQLLFGIRGRRWELEYADTIAPLFNEHWIRPSTAETPDGASAVEDGCYW